jgi:hypothetical protein
MQLKTTYISGDEELVVEVEVLLLLRVRRNGQDGTASGIEPTVGKGKNGLVVLAVGQEVGHVGVCKSDAKMWFKLTLSVLEQEVPLSYLILKEIILRVVCST